MPSLQLSFDGKKNMSFIKNVRFAQFITQTPTEEKPRPNFGGTVSPPPPSPPSPPKPPVVNPPQSQMPSYNVANAPEKPKKGFLKAFIILILIVLIAVLVAAGVLASRVWDPVWNPFRPSPEKVMAMMQEKMPEIKSGHTKLNAEINIFQNVSDIKMGATALATLEGDFDVNSASNPKSNFNVNFLAKPSSTGVDQKLELKANIITIGKNAIYVKVDSFAMDALGIQNNDLNQAIGKMVKIDQNSLKTLVGSENISSMPEINSQKIIKEIQNTVLNNGILIISKQLDDEVINGQKVYHYLATVDKNKLVELIFGATEEIASKSSIGNLSMTEMAKSMTQAAVDKIGDLNIDIYIGKNDYMLYKINFEKTITLQISDSETIQADVKMSNENSKFNEPISISEPKDAKPIEEFLTSFVEEQKEKAKEEKISSDVSSIKTIAENILKENKSYSTLCYRSLLNGSQKQQGAQLLKLNDDIIAQGANKPVCFANATNFCVSTKLKDGSYVCIGLNGLGKTQCVSANTKCVQGLVLQP